MSSQPEYHIEDRQVGSGLAMSLYTRGEHDESCDLTEHGWVCHDARCGVDDMPSVNKRRDVIDELLEVRTNIRRRWLRVFWSLDRLSERRTFFNGRSLRNSQAEIVIEEWFQGKTWTKRGAAKEIERVLQQEMPHRVAEGYRK